MAQQANHGGFLWIKGYPGTGKSTLMKFLFEKAKQIAKTDLSKIMLSFFFLARGTIEEKSTTGLYRSLLHQLFEKAADLKDSIEWMSPNGARVIQCNGWYEEVLKQTLMHAIEKLGHRLLTIFIDALDECGQDQVVDMVCFFEELCDRAKEAQIQLKICFSSRHYPSVVIKQGIDITLENEIGHTQDIEHYVKSKFRLGKSNQAKLLRLEILEKSCGIFLWVVLVLDILNSEYPNSHISLKKIRDRLKQIPPKLSDLFEMILTRDGDNIDRMRVCLQWILFATRPLKPQELYFAVSLGMNQECSGYWDQEDVDLDKIKTFVRTSSKGLAEVTRNKAAEVQFIHESVRDFLLDKHKSQWFGISSNFMGRSQEVLKDCCLAQLRVGLSHYIDVPNPFKKASKTAELRAMVSDMFPFLRYAVHNVLCHANIAQHKEVEQNRFLARFPLSHWIVLHNIFEFYDVLRYTAYVSLLYVLAERNLAGLIGIFPQKYHCYMVENERYGPPMFAALATKSFDAAQAFLRAQLEYLASKPTSPELLEEYSRSGLALPEFRGDFEFSERKGIHLHLTEHGSSAAFIAFYRAYINVPESMGFYQKPICWAASHGKNEVVDLLLDIGANVEDENDYGQTPLSLAAKNGHETVAALLLKHSAKLESKDRNSRTPLLLAAENSREAVLELLLDRGSNFEARDVMGRTPLLLIAEHGHETVLELLLDRGSNFKARDVMCRTPLLLAAENGKDAVVKLLLDKGSNFEARNITSRTPLSLAAGNGHHESVRLLLENGDVDPDSKDEHGKTPLLWTVINCCSQSGNLLDGTLRDKLWGNFLMVQQFKEIKMIAQIMEDRTLSKEDRSDKIKTFEWNILQYQKAKISIHHGVVIDLLLETGRVNIYSQDNEGCTPLPKAYAEGGQELANILLKASSKSSRSLNIPNIEASHRNLNV